MISSCILSLQLTVRVYNINSDKNNEILKKCETLKQYSLFLERVRALQGKGQLTASRITELIKSCIDCGILPEFLKKYVTEMVEMLFRELTREEDMEISRLDGFDEGLSQGLEQGRTDMRIELARAMKSYGRPIEQISEDTGLSAEEIEKI